MLCFNLKVKEWLRYCVLDLHKWLRCLCFSHAQVVDMLCFRLELCYLVSIKLLRNNILTYHIGCTYMQ